MVFLFIVMPQELGKMCSYGKWEIIFYASWIFNIQEMIYRTHYLEQKIVFAIEILMHILYGIHVYVFTDHKSLEYVFKQKYIKVVWFFKDYDMCVIYHPLNRMWRRILLVSN